MDDEEEKLFLERLTLRVWKARAEGAIIGGALSANISETSINLVITVGREVNLNDRQIRYH